LVIAYHLLTKDEPYKEFGSSHYEHQSIEVKKKKAIKHLASLGYDVTLTEKTA